MHSTWKQPTSADGTTVVGRFDSILHVDLVHCNKNLTNLPTPILPLQLVHQALVVLRGRAQLLDSRATLSGGALDPTSGANSGVLGSVSRPSVPLGDITATSTSAPMSASTSQRGAAGQEAADKALFVYGTLMNEEVSPSMNQPNPLQHLLLV